MKITKRQLRRIIREEKKAMTERQGYDAHENESLGMRRGPERDHSQSEKDRRDDSYGKWGSRDHSHADHHEDDQGYDDREDESLGVRRGAEKSGEQSYHDRRDDSKGRWGKRSRHEGCSRGVIRLTKNQLRGIIREVKRGLKRG